MRSPPDPRPVWRAIVAAGGIMPVSDTERARCKRVQATFRAALGLHEDTPEEQLIDTRQADRRSITELATAYLREYAARLDPAEDLEDIDRAALAWHPDNTASEVADALAALGELGQQDTAGEQLALFDGAWAQLLDSLR